MRSALRPNASTDTPSQVPRSSFAASFAASFGAVSAATASTTAAHSSSLRTIHLLTATGRSGPPRFAARAPYTGMTPPTGQCHQIKDVNRYLQRGGGAPIPHFAWIAHSLHGFSVATYSTPLQATGVVRI